VTRAKLGEESSFYYDETLKAWVDKNAPANATADATAGLSAPPVMPVRHDAYGSGGYGSPVSAGSNVPPVGAGGGGSPATGTRSRYVDVFARDGMTSTAPVAPVGGMSAFIPSAAPVGGAMMPPSGMQFFVPAPAAASETPREEETLSLMQPARREAATADDNTGKGDAIQNVSLAGESASASADVDAPAEDVPAAPGAFETNSGDGWIDPEGDSQERWDAPTSHVDHSGVFEAYGDNVGDMGEANASLATEQPQWEHVAAGSEWAVDARNDHLASETAAVSWGGETTDNVDASAFDAVAQDVNAESGVQEWQGYEGHEDYAYDPRWKFDDATQEWYWDGGNEDYDDWVERAVHDKAIADLQANVDARVLELEEMRAARQALEDALSSTAREKDAEIEALTTKIQTLETSIAERQGAISEAPSSEAVTEAFARGKEEGYAEGYAAGTADAQEELADLLVCLGQEGRRVDALRTMLAETGADIDAIIAQFEAEEEAQIEELVANQMGDADVNLDKVADPVETTVDDGESERWATSMENALPEISASMHAAAAEIATPERARDASRMSSTLNADADEFILPTPPKGARHERNLQNAFELA
jgi:hypothetical protein